MPAMDAAGPSRRSKPPIRHSVHGRYGRQGAGVLKRWFELIRPAWRRPRAHPNWRTGQVLAEERAKIDTAAYVKFYAEESQTDSWRNSPQCAIGRSGHRPAPAGRRSGSAHPVEFSSLHDYAQGRTGAGFGCTAVVKYASETPGACRRFYRVNPGEQALDEPGGIDAEEGRARTGGPKALVEYHDARRGGAVQLAAGDCQEFCARPVW